MSLAQDDFILANHTSPIYQRYKLTQRGIIFKPNTQSLTHKKSWCFKAINDDLQVKGLL